MERTKTPNLRNGSKGGFEPSLTWLWVRHSTAELPRSSNRLRWVEYSFGRYLYRCMEQRHGQQRQETGYEWNEDAAMDVWSHEEGYNRKEHARGSINVAPVTKKITEKRLKWYGHVPFCKRRMTYWTGQSGIMVLKTFRRLQIMGKPEEKRKGSVNMLVGKTSRFRKVDCLFSVGIWSELDRYWAHSVWSFDRCSGALSCARQCWTVSLPPSMFNRQNKL